MNPLPKISGRPVAKKPRHKQLMLLAVVVLLVAFGGWLAWDRHQKSAAAEASLAADKARFAKVEEEMGRVYARMVAAGGEPAESTKTKGCGYTNAKFERGALICNITYSFSYAEADANSADLRRLKVLGVIPGEGSKGTYFESGGHNAGYYFAGSTESTSCRLTYDYGASTLAGDYATSVSKTSLYQYRCSDNLKQPIYPLAE